MNPYRTPAKREREPRSLLDLISIALLAVVLIVINATMTACAIPDAKTVSSVALSIEQIACVIAQAELGQDEPTAVRTLCAIPPTAIDAVVNLILGQKRGHAMARAAMFPPDAGAPR